MKSYKARKLEKALFEFLKGLDDPEIGPYLREVHKKEIKELFELIKSKIKNPTGPVSEGLREESFSTRESSTRKDKPKND